MNRSTIRGCNAARRLIDLFLLDELDEAGSAALADHLRECAACSAELGSATRLLELLGGLPTPASTPDLDQRVLAAALADRDRRHERRSWLADLWVQVLRGAMRTTGTLVLTIVTVAAIGGAFVYAASNFIVNLPAEIAQQHATPTPTPNARVVAPTPTPTIAPTSSPTVSTSTSQPTQPPTTRPTTAPTPSPTPKPSESFEPTLTPLPAPTATPEPTPQPTPAPSPTEKVRRTPPPSPSPSPTPTPAPSGSTPSP